MERDRWAEWLLKRRFGTDEDGAPPDWLVNLNDVRDRVLDNAGLTGGETVLDVGAGDGLIAFGALDRGAGEVIFSDISDHLLEHSRRLATQLGVLDRSRFVHAPADDLSAFEDASVDIVTTRSVLIYVEHKRDAFAEFFRVLRPAGRLSVFEPINRFGSCFRVEESFWGYRLDGMRDIRDKVNAVYEAIQPDSDPMLDFDERDLVVLAEQAGFFPVRLTLELEVKPLEPRRWDQFLNTAGNPKIPTLAEAMQTALDDEERARLVGHLRPLVEQGRGEGRWATAYLWAEKQ